MSNIHPFLYDSILTLIVIMCGIYTKLHTNSYLPNIVVSEMVVYVVYTINVKGMVVVIWVVMVLVDTMSDFIPQNLWGTTTNNANKVHPVI